MQRAAQYLYNKSMYNNMLHMYVWRADSFHTPSTTPPIESSLAQLRPARQRSEAAAISEAQ
eukprot:8232699-Pyramimonas_sp.AAC.1